LSSYYDNCVAHWQATWDVTVRRLISADGWLGGGKQSNELDMFKTDWEELEMLEQLIEKLSTGT